MNDSRLILGSDVSRRRFLQASAFAGAGLAAGSFGLGSALRASESDVRASGAKLGQADSCIFIWLGGGQSQIDTWDPKRLSKGKSDPGSYYPAIDTSVPGIQVCEHLSGCAKRMEHFTLLRAVHHEVIDEHAAATHRVHTGRPTTATTTYPSIGSIVASQKGGRVEGVPPYLLIGYPSPSRGPGFLGAKNSYVYLVDTEQGPAGLKRDPAVSDLRQARREELLAKFRQDFVNEHPSDRRIAEYAEATVEGLKLAGPKFLSVFDLASEDPRLRETYGGEFGQRCLLARRLTEEGASFVEVSFNLNFINGTGWDSHNSGQANLHVLIQDLDRALSALIDDLKTRDRLDKTLIVVATEFGRPPEFDGGGGRGHQGSAFSIVLAGGGLAGGKAIGVTDDLSKNPIDRPMSVPDMHATILAALGIDPHLELYDGDRPVPVTDFGTAAPEAFV